MTQIWWVRHGPTHAKSMVGWTDLPADLSDGAALARLSAFLPDAPIVSSDLQRTRKTADALQAERLRLPDRPGLREFHYGEWENQAFDAIDSPDLRRYFDDPGHQRAPGGESWNDVDARVEQEVQALTSGHDALIIVAHMGVILTQWARALGVSPFEALAQKIDPLSVTQITISDQGRVASFANHKP